MMHSAASPGTPLTSLTSLVVCGIPSRPNPRYIPTKNAERPQRENSKTGPKDSKKQIQALKPVNVYLHWAIWIPRDAQEVLRKHSPSFPPSQESLVYMLLKFCAKSPSALGPWNIVSAACSRFIAFTSLVMGRWP